MIRYLLSKFILTEERIKGPSLEKRNQIIDFLRECYVELEYSRCIFCNTAAEVMLMAVIMA